MVVFSLKKCNFFSFFFSCFCCCSSVTVVLPLSPLLSPAPPPATVNHHHCLCPWVLYLCSLACSFLFFPPLFPSPAPSGHCHCEVLVAVLKWLEFRLFAKHHNFLSPERGERGLRGQKILTHEVHTCIFVVTLCFFYVK